MDAERVHPGLSEDDAGGGPVAALAVAVHLGQSFNLLGRRGGLADRDAQPDEDGASTAAASQFGQFDDNELWGQVQGGLRRGSGRMERMYCT